MPLNMKSIINNSSPAEKKWISRCDVRTSDHALKFNILRVTSQSENKKLGRGVYEYSSEVHVNKVTNISFTVGERIQVSNISV